MNNLVFCFTVFCTLILSSVAQYEFLMMTMQWQPAVCRPKDANCVKSPGNHFTIHGLWPQNKTDPQPRRCSSARKVANFDTQMVSLYFI
jgi:ribonuclease I